jgi:hypothetical protein
MRDFRFERGDVRRAFGMGFMLPPASVGAAPTTTPRPSEAGATIAPRLGIYLPRQPHP